VYCPRCGSSVGDGSVNFCPSCGYYVGYVPYTYTYAAPAAVGSGAKKQSKAATAALFAVLILALAAAVSLIADVEDDLKYNKVDIQTVTEDTYFELSGDFLIEREVFTVSLTNDGKIAFALNDDISSKYDYYSWTFFDNDHVSSADTRFYVAYSGETVNKEEPVLYYLSQNVGEYSISVKCYAGPEEERELLKTYSGTVRYSGTITKEYTWIYQGELYSAKTSFSFDEYRHYKEMNDKGRRVVDYGRVVSFVTYEDPAIVALAESIKEAYGDRSTSDQKFAAFVLGFVQICFDYPPYSTLMGADRYQYGQEEYFAYPMETIFYGMGDCEDTSILAAALFKALGYEAGVVMIPQHAVAAVGLDSYAPGSYSSRSYEIISQTIDGVTYYACETTVNSPQGIGLISLSGDEGTPYSEYIGKSRYGFYIV